MKTNTLSTLRTKWRRGKILWFDALSGEGLVLAENGESLYLHSSSLKDAKSETGFEDRAGNLAVRDNTEIQFTVYENANRVQIDKVKVN